MNIASATEAVDSVLIHDRVKSKTIKIGIQQLPCLMFSNEKVTVKPPPFVIDRWAGVSLIRKSKRSVCCFLDEETWGIKMLLKFLPWPTFYTILPIQFMLNKGQLLFHVRFLYQWHKAIVILTLFYLGWRGNFCPSHIFLL